VALGLRRVLAAHLVSGQIEGRVENCAQHLWAAEPASGSLPQWQTESRLRRPSHWFRSVLETTAGAQYWAVSKQRLSLQFRNSDRELNLWHGDRSGTASHNCLWKKLPFGR